MNYPLWEIPAPGLLIAFVAIVHVFISHFAVGGGLFLVIAERKARREADAALLAYVERHSHFFALLTLVAGALTGVGIWFTIALVHPSATASLIAAFVWGWAIEWTFFATEIAAAIVYAYGWHRLPAATHMRIGWIYFGAAWLSLAVINGILTYMLTPGAWITTRSFWDGVLNPTYLPSLVVRTAAAAGLAGVYSLMTMSWMADRDAKARIARYVGTRWVLPAAIVLPFSFVWYLTAASRAGVPVAETFGAATPSMGAILQAAIAAPIAPASGHPIAQHAVLAFAAASVLLILVTLFIVAWRPSAYGRPSAAVAMLCALVALGAAEFMREDLRKPFVIGRYMLITGVRLPPGPGVPQPSADAGGADRFTIDAVGQNGVMGSALWARRPVTTGESTRDAVALGGEVFRLSCSGCHTMNGYLAIRPLARGLSVGAANTLLGRLARPVDERGQPTDWSSAHVRMVSWRGRHMPPFVGTADERHALAAYLASVGGATPEAIARSADATVLGARVFDDNCSPCHGDEASYPFKDRVKGRGPDEFYALLGGLPQVNELMPPFEGTDPERRALAEYLPTLDDTMPGGAR